MGLRDLTLRDWARMNDATARQECEALARALPHGLQFAGLAAHAYCGREHKIARFSRREPGSVVHFVLVPGGEVTLGFDGREFTPTPQQMESFADSAEAYGIEQSIREYVQAHTSARRAVSVPPLLVEVEAREVGIEPVRASDAESRAGLKRGARVRNSDRYIVDRRGAGRRRPTSAADLQASLGAEGMRLLTSDEWEQACGAGAPALFRWGDDCPADFYPTDTSAEDRRQHTAWVLSGAGPEAPPPGPQGWDLHRRSNLFGLRIAANPYQVELVSDGPQVVGGDGGTSICGGAGFFLGWLPLATAFRDPYQGTWFKPDNVADGFSRVRRAIAIP